MEDFEKLGLFYLGREFDLGSAKPKENLVLYESRDLLTHGIAIGMTGSGKTGLCLSILEEAAIDGIPVIAIDPKGDLGNLLLTFPSLSTSEFAPWVDSDEARRQAMSEQDFASKQAETWKRGLAESGQTKERIAKLKESSDFAIYTPAAGFGCPVSILGSFDAPDKATLDDRDLLREKIGSTVACLLSLLAIDADPLKSREHILLATIFNTVWSRGGNLSLADLIQLIQKPPFAKIGAVDLESFFPAKERFEFSMSLNNLLASPGFDAWMEGEPLEIDRFLYDTKGKPRISIFSIAHLSDSERMFFVSLLLNQLLAWMRKQSGTTSLRAIFYMDEIYGYFPPTANPPSKTPLMTLLKQARAFGLGCLLATQNPVDLDYKALSNIGTWFLGRLQTERDKARVMDGLEGASLSAGQSFNRKEMETMLSALATRVFLMNNVHEDHPVVFQTRWTLSYLRGPLSRNQIKQLIKGHNQEESLRAKAVAANPAPQVSQTLKERSAACEDNHQPLIPPGIAEYFIATKGKPEDSGLVYRPRIFGAATVRYVDTRTKVDLTRNCAYFAKIEDSPNGCSWQSASETDFSVSDLKESSEAGAKFAPLAQAATMPENYKKLNKDLVTFLGGKPLQIFSSLITEEFSRPNESERDFRIRLSHETKERRDELFDQLRQKYAPKIASLSDKILKAEQKLDKHVQASQASQINTAVEVGATVFGALFGRKTLSARNISRASSAAKQASKTAKAQQDVEHAQESLDVLAQQLQNVESEFQREMSALQTKVDPQYERLETISIEPKKVNINVTLVALVWIPYWKGADDKLVPAWR